MSPDVEVLPLLIFLVGADVDSRVLSKADKNYVKNAVFRAH